ncbi:AAA family ATPase [Paenibacillus mucilaginosus]|uniref:AAA ATPase n=2 Tax=Paenibacillus mucilaginosus TaxID=61624 RepID=H6NKC7_9BACL|nr:AAA family ATPase [Paenibacillus mucilaginosus]AEI44030.1 AAA ATPase [Paenibacillus mucilaginosus KNP414]AFC31611.1 AAA ATPase [Paenibacillus mucilaginosus 3016]MCG7212482.1 AAA family ATPase [Paenibacillus mucilaginosus]WDM25482.1 AAA family ATPase [Paenibacillus mucilaginosus]WFA20148.1 ATP-binding cassette domain-containing protein [Paenibacillus mucilaginosus]
MYLRELTLLRSRIPDDSVYPFNIPAVRHLDTLNFSGSITFFVGENGSGKSTLLEAIAYQCGFHTAGGGRNNTYEVDAAHSALGDYLRLSWMPKVTSGFFLRAETFYQFASYLDRNPESLHSYGGKSLHRQSHGESFLSLFVHRFGGKALYLLDEPEAALSPARQLSLLRIMKNLEDRAQFIVATHSPILLGYPGAAILNFDDVPVAPIRYEDTAHYVLTRQFLENRDRLLHELFKDDEDEE